MASNPVIGQDRIREALLAARASGRVAHAYLFYGPQGSGKRAVAIEFAASLLCSEAEGGAACRQCNTCSRALKIAHPDLHFLMPAPRDTSQESLRERLELLAENPYAVVDFQRRPSLDSADAVSNKQVIYSKENIGVELRRLMSLAPAEGGYRVAILTDADRMRTEAANAFLKLLEEPGERTVFVLTTDRPDRLLATIRSRCQALRFDRLSDDDVARALAARLSLKEDAARTLARLSDGSFSRALDLASSEDLVQTRLLVVDFLRTAFTNDSEAVVGFADSLSRTGRETIKFFLGLMLSWLRDLLLFRTTGDRNHVVNLDQFEEIRKFCSNLPSAELENMVAVVEEAAGLVERNMNLRLTFIVLAQSLGKAMRGRPVPGLVVPLTDP